MRSDLVRFLSASSLILMAILLASSPAQAQAVFDGSYSIPPTGEMGDVQITIDPLTGEMILDCDILPGSTVFFFPCSDGPIVLNGTPGSGVYSGPVPAPPGPGIGNITVTIAGTGVVDVTVDDVFGPCPNPGRCFTGNGTIDDPTLVAPVNTVSINFIPDPSQMITGMGTLTAAVTTPLPAPAPTMSLPLLALLAALLIGVGALWSRRRIAPTAG